MEKIKVISKKKINESTWGYTVKSYHAITYVEFSKVHRFGWCLNGKSYIWNRAFIVFAEAVIRGLSSNEKV